MKLTFEHENKSYTIETDSVDDMFAIKSRIEAVPEEPEAYSLFDPKMLAKFITKDNVEYVSCFEKALKPCDLLKNQFDIEKKTKQFLMERVMDDLDQYS